MASSPAIILKVVSLIILFVVTVVGCHAHFDSFWKDAWDAAEGPEGCKLAGQLIGEKCPTGAIPMERTFVALTIICLILSTMSLVAGFVMDVSKIKAPDAGYHALAGILIFISGILLIVAAVQIDNFSIKMLESVYGIIGRGGSAGVLSNDSVFVKSLMPKATVVVDSFSLKDDLRKELKYMNKLAAGSLAIINGVFYFVTSAAIFKS